MAGSRKARRADGPPAFDGPGFVARRARPVPFEFVLERIARLAPTTRPMFGCLAVYVEDRIVFILRDKARGDPDNGVWLATSVEHHESLRGDFPTMRSIRLFERDVSAWQVLAADDPDFEELAGRACDLVLAGDPRIGKIPKRRRGVAARRAEEGGYDRPARAGAARKPAARSGTTVKRRSRS